MDALRLNHVVFCGENPHVVLVHPNTEIVSAAASYWHCTYSDYGGGNVLLLYLDADNAKLLNHPISIVYADNEALARYLVETFNQHFEDWDNLGFDTAAIQSAIFTRDTDSRQYYRITCNSESDLIEIGWQDIRDISFRTFPDLQAGGFGAKGDEHYHVSNVIFLCAQGSISLNQHQAGGIVQLPIRADGRFSSSVFLALSETWVKVDQA